MITYILREKIDPKKLNWYELQVFQHRTYYQCDDLHSFGVLSFTETDEDEIGVRFVYPGRFITIKSEQDSLRISIPIEEPFPNRKYWLPGTIDEAFWLAGWTRMRIAIESDAVESNFAVTCVYTRHQFEELKRIHELRQLHKDKLTEF